MSNSSKTLTDKIFKDKNGKVVLTQMPNVPLWGWIAGTALSYLFTRGKLHDLAQILAFGSLFTWAYLEITHGVNYFRRLFGTVVLVAIVISRIQ